MLNSKLINGFLFLLTLSNELFCVFLLHSVLRGNERMDCIINLIISSKGRPFNRWMIKESEMVYTVANYFF